jgi:hypothetical protein
MRGRSARRTLGAWTNRSGTTSRYGRRAVVERVVEWDRATPHDYDHRWINLHGMGAVTGSGPLSRPAAEWPAIGERTREEYLRGLDEALGGIP